MNAIVNENEKLREKDIGQILAHSCRVDVNGWIYVHLQGDAYQMGFQNGYLLGHEVREQIENLKLNVEAQFKRNWQFFCETGMQLYWPKLSEEYRREIQGVVAGVRARQIGDISLADIVALNGYFDTESYVAWLSAKEGKAHDYSGGEHCSAFAATGKWTKDGKIVIAHSTWFWKLVAVGYNIVASVSPTTGNEFMMQTSPGTIWSGCDMYLSNSGLTAVETSITGINTFNPQGAPCFMRARKAIQYAKTIDQWAKIMIEDNNGGYANDWLVGDVKTGEIACLELGTFNYALDRTFDGVFVGSNVATNEEVRSETTIDYRDTSTSHLARRERWKQLTESSKGSIDVETAKRFLADHYDSYSGSDTPNRNSICGHVELDNRGWPDWGMGPYYPAGAHDGKIMSTDLGLVGAFWAHWGAPCDTPFIANSFLSEHPEYSWQKPRLKSIEPYPWTLFSSNPKWKVS